MKYTFFIIGAAALMFTACKKKKDGTNCYVCTRNTAIHSTNPDPALNNPHYVVDIDTICNYNDGRINIYIKDHTKSDTMEVVNGAFVLRDYTESCIVE